MIAVDYFRQINFKTWRSWNLSSVFVGDSPCRQPARPRSDWQRWARTRTCDRWNLGAPPPWWKRRCGRPSPRPWTTGSAPCTLTAPPHSGARGREDTVTSCYIYQTDFTYVNVIWRHPPRVHAVCCYLFWKYREGGWCDIHRDRSPLVSIFAIHCRLQCIIDYIHTWRRREIHQTLTTEPQRAQKVHKQMTCLESFIYFKVFSHRLALPQPHSQGNKHGSAGRVHFLEQETL